MNDWLDIKGKTVLVTGASSGIGKAIVEELLELGVNVANFDLSDNDLRHPNLLFVKVDVTSRSEVEAGVAKIVERFGNIDAVVNNAGINVPRLLIDAENPKGPYELDDETFEKITMINQKGLYLVSQAVGRILVKNGKGVIVNMASEAVLKDKVPMLPQKQQSIVTLVHGRKSLVSMVYVWLELLQELWKLRDFELFLMRKLLLIPVERR